MAKRAAASAAAKPAEDEGSAALPALPDDAHQRPIALRWDDPAHPKGVEYHPSGRPMVRYGPAPKYPQGEAEEALCGLIIEYGAQGYSFHAIALKIGFPPSTLTSWASQPYGVKLRDAIALADQYARGALEGEARDNTANGKYNVALWGKIMASRYPEYRVASGGGRLDDDGKGIAAGLLPNDEEAQREFERRLLSTMDRARRGEISLGAPHALIEHKDDEK